MLSRAGSNSQVLALSAYRKWVFAGVLVLMIGFGASVAVQLLTKSPYGSSVPSDIAMVLLGFVGLLLLRAGHPETAARMLLAGFWIELHYVAIIRGSLSLPAAFPLAPGIAAAGVFLGPRWALVGGVVSAVTFPLAAVLGAEVFGTGPGIGPNELHMVTVFAFALGATGIITYLAARAFSELLSTALASERRNTQLVEHAPDGIVLLGPHGEVEAMNPAAEILLRIEPGTGLGLRLADLFARLAPGTDPGSALPPSLSFRGPGDRPCYVEIVASAAPGAAGEPGTQVTIRDVTARREIEERALQLGRMIDQSQSEIYVVHPGTLRVRFASHGARTKLGYGPDELAAVSITEINPGLDRPRIQAFLRASVRDASVGESGRAIHRRKDGTVYPVEIRLQSGAFEGELALMVFAVDASERMVAEREQERLRGQLEHAQKLEAVAQLAGGVAHDFNNALMAIGGFAEILEASTEDEQMRGWLREIRRAQERGADLTRGLLAFARRELTQPEALSLSAVITDMQPILRRLLGEKHELHVETLGRDRVWLDRSQLEQVVINLLTNARDAMAAGGPVRILLGEPGARPDGDAPTHEGLEGCVLLEVQDAGTGMDEATRARIFQPFFTTKPRGKGTGLGLATVYGIVTQNGGQIEVHSAPGWGTRMRVFWPPGPEAETAPRGGAEGAGALPRAGAVLLVEDDPGARRLLQLMLVRAGLTVHAAPSGEEALDHLKSQPAGPDVLLTDVVLPGMSGFDVATQVRALHPNVRTLFMSGYLDDMPPSEGFDPERDLLLKPFTRATLMERITALLRS